ncbi:MAG TPA: hypothetical protein VH475_23180 [Tepidisphaeraceae bacterium]|jgi:hypothetical protein
MAKPTQAALDAALAEGKNLPAGDYAIDWAHGGIVRDLTTEEKAAAKKDADELAATKATPDAAPAPSAG